VGRGSGVPGEYQSKSPLEDDSNPRFRKGSKVKVSLRPLSGLRSLGGKGFGVVTGRVVNDRANDAHYGAKASPPTEKTAKKKRSRGKPTSKIHGKTTTSADFSTWRQLYLDTEDVWVKLATKGREKKSCNATVGR